MGNKNHFRYISQIFSEISNNTVINYFSSILFSREEGHSQFHRYTKWNIEPYLEPDSLLLYHTAYNRTLDAFDLPARERETYVSFELSAARWCKQQILHGDDRQ